MTKKQRIIIALGGVAVLAGLIGAFALGKEYAEEKHERNLLKSSQQTQSPNKTTPNNQSTQTVPTNQTGGAPNQQFITAEHAKQAVLADAKLKEADITHFKSKLDAEHGVAVYEIEFRHNGYEHDYDINAITGVIVKKEIQRERF